MGGCETGHLPRGAASFKYPILRPRRKRVALTNALRTNFSHRHIDQTPVVVPVSAPLHMQSPSDNLRRQLFCPGSLHPRAEPERVAVGSLAGWRCRRMRQPVRIAQTREQYQGSTSLPLPCWYLHESVGYKRTRISEITCWRSTVSGCQFVERKSIELLTTYKQLRSNEQFQNAQRYELARISPPFSCFAGYGPRAGRAALRPGVDEMETNSCDRRFNICGAYTFGRCLIHQVSEFLLG